MAKKVEEAIREIKGFIHILQNAKDRKSNEADTRTVVHKFISDVLGYDFINDITKEFMIRGTYVDFGIKIDEEIKFLVEAKQIGTKLKESHVRQTVNYAVNKGISWCVLTDGAVWRLYRIEFQQPIKTIQVFEIDLLALPPSESGRLLWLLSKPSMKKGEIDKFWRIQETLNDSNILKALFAEDTIKIVRRKLKNITNELLPLEDITTALRGLLTEKARDILDGSGIKIKKKRKKRTRRKTEETDQEDKTEDEGTDEDGGDDEREGDLENEHKTEI